MRFVNEHWISLERICYKITWENTTFWVKNLDEFMWIFRNHIRAKRFKQKLKYSIPGKVLVSKQKSYDTWSKQVGHACFLASTWKNRLFLDSYRSFV